MGREVVWGRGGVEERWCGGEVVWRRGGVWRGGVGERWCGGEVVCGEVVWGFISTQSNADVAFNPKLTPFGT